MTEAAPIDELGPTTDRDPAAADPRRPFKLPCRRESVSSTFIWDDSKNNKHRFEMSLGFDPDTHVVREVFAYGHQEGSTMRNIFERASVLISYCLQAGYTLEDLLAGIGHENLTVTHPGKDQKLCVVSVCPIAAVIRAALEFEAHGPYVPPTQGPGVGE